MPEEVGESWQRITTWLRTRAPVTAAALAAASEADLAELVEDVPVPLPADLATWWRLCGGTGLPDGDGALFPPFYEPHSARGALEARRLLVTPGTATSHRASGSDEAGDRAAVFLDVFVPIAADGTGDHLVVDLRPGRWHGCVQHWSADDGCQTGPWWTGVADLLSDVANAVTRGTRAREAYAERARARHLRASAQLAHVEQGRLTWQPFRG